MKKIPKLGYKNHPIDSSFTKLYLDPNIDRKSKIISKSFSLYKNKFPLPSLIEISNSGVCNRECSFCPRSDPEYNHKEEFINNELHDKIFKELSNFDYSGMVVYSGFNEPLLKKDIYRDIEVARKYVPKATIELITNGDVLNNKRLKMLFESGLSTILISVYDGEEDVKKFQKMCDENNLKKSQYVIRKRFLPKEQDFGITMSNRSGLLKNAEHSIQPLSKSLDQICNYPGYTFFVDYNGDVLMCSHDWGKQKILGNMNNNSLINIWNSDQALTARKKLINAERSFSPCNKCDVTGNLIGNTQAEAWRKNFNS